MQISEREISRCNLYLKLGLAKRPHNSTFSSGAFEFLDVDVLAYLNFSKHRPPPFSPRQVPNLCVSSYRIQEVQENERQNVPDRDWNRASLGCRGEHRKRPAGNPTQIIIFPRCKKPILDDPAKFRPRQFASTANRRRIIASKQDEKSSENQVQVPFSSSSCPQAVP